MGELADENGHPADPPSAGSAQRYELLTLLAVGGMAEIHLARMRGIGGFERYVVVKQLLPHFTEDPEFLSLFLDEARLAARLDHQNIAQVYDIGQLDGRHFFAMEYIHGKDVRTIHKRVRQLGERIPLKYALTIVSNVAAALYYAHKCCDEAGKPLCVVHRDVSPANMIATYDGGVKLVDFGIARATTRSVKTRAGTVRGKLSYMSPEQCMGAELDARSDIFSLGIVLYELSTTSRLFRVDAENSDYAIMDRIVKGKFAPPSQLVADLPVELEHVIMRALAVKPADRYQDAQELLVDLEALASMERISLSTAALSQYLVDLFGREPEPWHVLEAGAPVHDGRVQAPITAEQTSRRLALPLPADGTGHGPAAAMAPATAGVNARLAGQSGSAVSSKVEVGRTLPSPPPEVELDSVSITLVPDGPTGWSAFLIILAVMIGFVALGLLL